MEWIHTAASVAVVIGFMAGVFSYSVLKPLNKAIDNLDRAIAELRMDMLTAEDRRHQMELLDKLRENIGGPLEVSCMYRCPAHNVAVGGVPNSQHVQGTAADVQTPDFPHCHTPKQLMWYCRQLPFDGIGLYDWGCHVDVRNGGVGAGIE